MKLPASFFILLLLSFFSVAQPSTIDSIKKVLKNAPDDTNKVTLLNRLAEQSFRYLNSPDSALLNIYYSSLALAEKLNYERGILRACLKGGIMMRVHGNYKAAHVFFNKVINRSQNHTSNLATAYIGKGNCYSEEGNYSMAADCFYKGLKIAEAVNDKVRIASSYNSLGNLYLEQNECEKAIFYHLSSLKMRLKINDSLTMSHSFYNSGNSYLKCHKYDSAVFYYSKALQIQILRDNKTGQSYSYNGIGECYFEREQYQAALDYFKRSYKLILTGDDANHLITVLISTGKAYLKLNENDSSFKYFNAAELKCKEINKASGLLPIYSGLSQLYEHKKDFEKALSYHKLYLKANDSVFSSESTKKIAAIENRYQVEQEKKIQMLEAEKLKMQHAAEVKKVQLILFFVALVGLIGIVSSLMIFRQYKAKKSANEIISKQKAEAENQKHIIEEKQKEIIDSIRYAKRIQQSLLTNEKYISKHLEKNKP